MKRILDVILHFFRQLLALKRASKRYIVPIITMLLVQAPLNVSAAAITSQSSFVSGNQWINAYTVIAEASDAPIWEFTIYFDPLRYAGLAVVSLPSGWDALVVQPDSGLPADGFFDALVLNAALNPGETLGGFIVSYEYLGAGTPPRQAFDIVDPVTFETISTGFTTVESVPEPRTLALLLPGFGLLILSLRRSKMLRRHGPRQPRTRF